MTFPALLDAAWLYPTYLCDALPRLAELRRNPIDASVDRADRRIVCMSQSFPSTAGGSPTYRHSPPQRTQVDYFADTGDQLNHT